MVSGALIYIPNLTKIGSGVQTLIGGYTDTHTNTHTNTHTHTHTRTATWSHKPGYRSRGPGFDSLRFQIFWEAAGLKRGPLSLVRTTEELLEGNIAAPVYKTEINDRGNPLRWLRDNLYARKLALTSPTSGGRSVDIVCSRTKATEFSCSFRNVG
jgi:hypothetical protein